MSAPHTPAPQPLRYTVRELARLSGVSVRTLHHYDASGLLCPMRQDNNYRIYGADEVDRLQHILLYREVGLALADIKELLDGGTFDAACALKEHLVRLKEQRERTGQLIANVEKTLAGMKGETTMDDSEKFKGFKQKLVEENEQTYGEEIRAAHGDAAIDASNARVMGMSEAAWEQAQQLQEEIASALREGMAAKDPAGKAAQRACDLHRQWLLVFWKEGTYSKEAHRGLAEMYVADDRFKAYYDKIAPGAAEFLRDALAVYCS